MGISFYNYREILWILKGGRGENGVFTGFLMKVIGLLTASGNRYIKSV